jgi:hypothetical protein
MAAHRYGRGLCRTPEQVAWAGRLIADVLVALDELGGVRGR